MRALIALIVATLLFPFAALAFPFGGQASIVLPCYNGAIYANLGAPIGGPFIWTPGTRAYSHGAPYHSGQWALGLAGAPYYCIVSIEPIIVFPGTAVIMSGSSQ